MRWENLQVVFTSKIHHSCLHFVCELRSVLLLQVPVKGHALADCYCRLSAWWFDMIWLKVTTRKTEKRTHNIHNIYISYIKLQHKKTVYLFIHNISRRCRSQVVYSQAATNNDKTQSHWREQACGIWPDGRYTLIVFNYQVCSSIILISLIQIRWFCCVIWWCFECVGFSQINTSKRQRSISCAAQLP